jgi:hypothetical protein
VSGVPQGTVLGPLLFLIYINDISDGISAGTTVRLFADDCVVYRPILAPSDRRSLQGDISVLHNWSTQWQMHFNPKKCTVMHLNSKGNADPYPYYMADSKLDSVKNHKYLGVTLTDNLHWKTHVDNACNKANRIQ